MAQFCKVNDGDLSGQTNEFKPDGKEKTLARLSGVAMIFSQSNFTEFPGIRVRMLRNGSGISAKVGQVNWGSGDDFVKK